MRYFIPLLLALAALPTCAVERVSGLLVEHRLVVPVRPLVEALGGTVRAFTPGTGVEARLGGRRYVCYVDTDIPLPFTPFIYKGQVHVNLVYLAYGLHLGRAWDPRTNISTVTAGDRQVACVPARVIAAAPRARGLHPLIDAREGTLIGGILHGTWGDDGALRPHVPRTSYRRYALSGPAGSVRGARPQEIEDVSAGIGVALSRPAAFPGDCLGLAAPWPAMPRLPVPLNARGPLPARIARDVLRRFGLPRAPVRVTQALQVDLAGDGRYTTLVCGEHPQWDATRSWGQVGDYSFVALRTPARRGWAVRVLSGAFCATPRGEADLLRHRVAGILDVDGDGRLEIVVGRIYYEGEGFGVYTVDNGNCTQVFSNYTGL